MAQKLLNSDLAELISKMKLAQQYVMTRLVPAPAAPAIFACQLTFYFKCSLYVFVCACVCIVYKRTTRNTCWWLLMPWQWTPRTCWTSSTNHDSRWSGFSRTRPEGWMSDGAWKKRKWWAAGKTRLKQSASSPPFPASFDTSDTPTAPHWLLTLAALCSYHLETIFLLLDHLLLPLDVTLWFFWWLASRIAGVRTLGGSNRTTGTVALGRGRGWSLNTLSYPYCYY